MFTRLAMTLFVLMALVGGTGVATADTSDNARACPEDGNPSKGLQTSVTASDWKSLNAAEGVNQAYESVGCDASLAL